MAIVKKDPHVGDNFEAFLAEDGQLAAATAIAIKRVLTWQIEQAMKQGNVSQAELARRMKTIRAVIHRLLDADDPALTLSTISKVAYALGLCFRLQPAAALMRWCSSENPARALSLNDCRRLLVDKNPRSSAERSRAPPARLSHKHGATPPATAWIDATHLAGESRKYLSPKRRPPVRVGSSDCQLRAGERNVFSLSP
jgi:predicted XRE-type DNA-binding protein